MSWNCIGTGVAGANHKRKGLPMQDAYMSMVDRDKLYVSLADGHGSSLCFRSDIGSSLAVLSAIEIIKHHAEQIIKLKDEKQREVATRNVSQAIIAYWSRQVLEHLKRAPFLQDEISSLSDEHKKRLSMNALLAYGSTLMLTVCSRSVVFGFSIGDGDAIAEIDGAVSYLLNQDAEIGESTYSLCTPDVGPYVKYYAMDSKKSSCMLMSTDGYRKSFETDEDFFAVLRDIKKLHDEDGISALNENLKTWLEETTEQGSGDDISCCFMYNRLYK